MKLFINDHLLGSELSLISGTLQSNEGNLGSGGFTAIDNKIRHFSFESVSAVIVIGKISEGEIVDSPPGVQDLSSDLLEIAEQTVSDLGESITDIGELFEKISRGRPNDN